MRYCAVCGKPLIEGRRVGPYCIECFAKLFKLLCVPERIVFDYCKYCGSYRFGYRWYEGGSLEDAITNYLKLALTSVKSCRSEVRRYEFKGFTFITQPSWRTFVEAYFSIEIDGIDGYVEQKYMIEVRANPTICPSCKTSRGGDYTVVLQLRGASPAVLARSLEELFESNDRVRSSVVDVVEYKNGVDIFMLDVGSARRIVKELKKKYVVNVRTTGEDVGVTSAGKLRRRTVISVRIKRLRGE